MWSRPRVTEALLDAARDYGRRACIMRGPGEYSNATHERQGVLIDGFNSEPCFEQTHNYPYYPDLLERYGLQKTKDTMRTSLMYARQKTRLPRMWSWPPNAAASYSGRSSPKGCARHPAGHKHIQQLGPRTGASSHHRTRGRRYRSHPQTHPRPGSGTFRVHRRKPWLYLGPSPTTGRCAPVGSGTGTRRRAWRA